MKVRDIEKEIAVVANEIIKEIPLDIKELLKYEESISETEIKNKNDVIVGMKIMAMILIGLGAIGSKIVTTENVEEDLKQIMDIIDKDILSN